ISFDMNALAEATMLKEQATRALQLRRGRMRELMLKRFGGNDVGTVAEKLPPDLRAEWQAADRDWQLAWAEVYGLCEHNQRFLKHSLRNLGMVLDHFRRLI